MQQEITHQMMGYDRSSMFAPDGRLLQAEYAKEAVRQSSTAIGMVCKDGVLLIADKRVSDKLAVPESVEKIFQIDEHIAAAATGYVMDGRVLIERAQIIVQNHRITFGVPMDTLSLVKEISDVKQFFTQYGGARPFGVSILFVGVDDKETSLYMTDPTGVFFGFKAVAVGEGEQESKAVLEQEYNEGIAIKDGIALALKALRKALGKRFDIRRIDGAYIKLDEKKFIRLGKKELKA